MDLRAASASEWDVIVVGTGIGGATFGHALAKAGRRVLFCERGPVPAQIDAAGYGSYPELAFARADVPRPIYGDILARAGRYADAIEDHSTSQHRQFVPFIGTGPGGSSALFGMAMERFVASDFEPASAHPRVPQSTLPERWPISFADLAPYYTRAESLYRVRGAGHPADGAGERAPSGPPPAMSGAARELFDFFQGKGLHPYRLPLACEFLPGCDCCQGFRCARGCKNDSNTICLQPALTEHGATLLGGCEVIRLEATAHEVTSVVCREGSAEIALHGKLVALAGGALESPALLLRSASPLWPDGLANLSGLVGRNLMRHCVDLYAVYPRDGAAITGHKEIAFNDLYETAQGQKLGTVQSFGELPPPRMLVASLEDDIRHGAARWAAPLFGAVKSIVAPVLARVFAGSYVLATIMEDLPYHGNRIRPATEQTGTQPRLEIEYRLQPYEAKRVEAFRAEMGKLLAPYRFRLIPGAAKNAMLAHACGTCRFGTDAEDSVLDPDNQAHGIRNLYVVDSSFFPSSGGTNPALTIAANAIRVADRVLQR